MPNKVADTLPPENDLAARFARIQQMRKANPVYEPGEPAGRGPLPEQDSTSVGKKFVWADFSDFPMEFSQDELIPAKAEDLNVEANEDLSVDDFVEMILSALSPSALTFSKPHQYAAFKKVVEHLGEMRKAERVEQNNETSTTDDTQAVQKVKKTRLAKLSLIPALAPAANVAIRSRLFTTGIGPREVYQKFTPITTWHKELLVEYQGEELRQDDCSVWIQLCKLAANDPQFQVKCTIYSLLKSLKKSDTGGNRKLLKQQLQRLFQSKLHIKFGKAEYYGSMFPEYAIDSKGYIVANLSKTIAKLLGIYDFTMVNMEVRLSLAYTAQWFHLFLKSQSGPEVIIPWEKIHELCGTAQINMENFIRNFRKLSIKPLMEIGFILSAQTRQGRLIVTIDKEKG